MQNCPGAAQLVLCIAFLVKNTRCCRGFLSTLMGKIKCYWHRPKTKNNHHLEKNIVSKFQKILSAHSACARKWALKVHKNRCFCSFLGWRFAATVSEQKTKMSGTSRRIKYQKIKKFHHAVFEKFEKEHNKTGVFAPLQVQKTKNSKIGLCTFFRFATRNPLKKKLWKSVARSSRKRVRTNGRTYEAKIIGPFGLRPGTNKISKGGESNVLIRP